MGVEDETVVFEQLDSLKLGYVTAAQIQQIHEALYFTPVSHDHVQAAIRHVCGGGSSGHVTRKTFVPVLQEIDRRQSVVEQAYWDFQSLDTDGDQRIAVKDALLLFRDFHGDNFSMDAWRDFLDARVEPDADVYFDEISSWLCVIPPGGDHVDGGQMLEEKSRVEEKQLEYRANQYYSISKFTESDENIQDELRIGAKRKLNRWNKYGLEAVLFGDDVDDLDTDDSVPIKRSRNSVGLSDVINILGSKYALLQDHLLREMAKHAADSETEISEVYEQLKRECRTLKGENLEERLSEMPGSRSILSDSLSGLMGEVGARLGSRYNEQEAEVTQLKAEGKSDREIAAIVKGRYHSSLPGPTSCGKAFIELMDRHQTEKSAIHDRAQSVSSRIFGEYVRLSRQCLLLEEDPEFGTAALAVGLAERSPGQVYPGYNWDRTRSEALARGRLEQRDGRRPVRTGGDVSEPGGEEGKLDLQMLVLAEIERKQFLEREGLIYMLQGHDAQGAVSVATTMTPVERRRRITTLRSQHQTWKESATLQDVPSKQGHQQMLQEGVGVYWIGRQTKLEQEVVNPTPREVALSILADLQHAQEVEMEIKLNSLHKKTTKVLSNMLHKESLSRVLEHFDNIAYVTLGAVDVDDGDREYLDGVNRKYKALRDVLLTFALKDQYGSEWIRFSEERKHKELSRVRKDEKSLRGEGKLEEMGRILGPKSQTLPSLKILMGDVKQFGPASESSEENGPPINLLADLVTRGDGEQERLASWLKSGQVQDLSVGRRRLELLRLRLEARCAGLETDYEVVLLSAGLTERLGRAPRIDSDSGRQTQLATRRVQLHREKVLQSLARTQSLGKSPTPQGDVFVWRDAYADEVQRRHYEERDRLLCLLQDESLRELVEVAGQMPRAERLARLAELRAKHLEMGVLKADNQDEYTDILEESAALQMVCRTEVLRKKRGQAVAPDHVIADILTVLQILQDEEMTAVLDTIGQQNESELQEAWKRESKTRQLRTVPNVLHVLTASEEDGHNKQVLQILDSKYCLLRDQLLSLSLANQEGDKKRLMEVLKAKEEALWKNGDEQGLSSLVKVSLKDGILDLMGIDREEYFSRVAEKQDDVQKVRLIDEKETKGRHLLPDLLGRYRNEKKYISRCLQGMIGRCSTQADRSELTTRLYREAEMLASMTESQHSFETSAMAVGLAERQEEPQHQLKNDRKRYIRVGTLLWQQRNEKKIVPKDISAVKSSDVAHLNRNLVKLLQIYHTKEVHTFMSMLADNDDQELQMTASLSTEQQRADNLSALHAEYSPLGQGSTKDNMKLLQDATVVKRESRRPQLAQDCQNDDNVCTSLMADLLAEQNQHAEKYIKAMATMTTDELTELQTEMKDLGESGRWDCIATVLFAMELKDGLSDQDVLQAVEEKYDALNDKLLMEALMNELGEANWTRLSEKERQTKLMELKLKQRKLKKQGLFDEAAALLGSLQTDKESLMRLMGDNKEEQERKLKEKMEKRRQRKAEGKTESECDELEKADVETEETEMRKKNILLQMDQKMEQEKQALMKLLQETGDNLEKERERQRALACLRMEQRRVRQEDKFDSAALMLGLAEEQGQKVETQKNEERIRQERLARERLAAAKRRREMGQTPGQPGQLDLQVDSVVDSELLMVIMVLMDRKHQAERATFIECCESEAREKTDHMTDKELESHLETLRGFRNGWRKSQTKPPQQQISIFMEAVSCILEQRQRASSETDCIVALLADLQQIQGHDMTHLLKRIQQQNPTVLREEMEQIATAIHECWHDNVATLLKLTLGEDAKPEDEVLQELDNKYDALKDKLIIEALLKQHGEERWLHMTEQDRQNKMIKMKLEERRLRREGKRDELSAVLGIYLQDKTELEKLLGESKDVQKKRLEERMAKRRKLQEEREAAGLTTNEEDLETILQEEEATDTQKTSVLDTLALQYDAERDALMSMLDAKRGQFDEERAKQAAIVRLNHEKKQLQKEDNLDSACLIFSLGQQAATDKQKSLASQRERQHQLAQDRITALKKKRASAANEENNVTSLTARLAKETKDRSGLSVEQQLLDDMDCRQDQERDVLVQLLHAASTDTAARKTAAKIKAVQGLKQELASVHHEHSKWLAKSRQTVLSKDTSKPAEIAKRRTQQFDLLKKALVYRLEVESRILAGNASKADLSAYEDQIGVQIMADLQRKQTDDAKLISSLISQKEEEFLQKVSDMQRLAGREGWYDNLTAVLFIVSDDQPAEIQGGPLSDTDQALEQLEEEFEREKTEAVEKDVAKPKRPLSALTSGVPVDTDALLKQLEEDQNIRRQVFHDQHEKQRIEIQRRLEARRMSNANKEFEAATAVHLIKMAESQSQAVASKASLEKGRQGSQLQDRIAARRLARKRQAEGDTEEEQPPSAPLTPLPSTGSFVRERSLGAEVSEENKQAVTRQLVRQQENLKKKIAEEQDRQEQMFKRRLEQKKGKLKNEAAELYSLGERQKTVLETLQKDERDRQLSLMVERKNRLLIERTKTHHSNSSVESGGFDEMVKDKGDNLSKDEKMDLAAKQLQVKFKQEAEGLKEPNGGLLDDKARFDQLKARKRQRKDKTLQVTTINEDNI